jgi:hypothetical protein
VAEKETSELPEQLTITLRKPVDLKDGKLEAIELREPNAGEFKRFTKRAESDAGAALVQLIAEVAGHPVPIIDRLGVRDMNEAAEYLMGFIQPSQATPAT